MIYGRISHWLCVHCAEVQPETGWYPTCCWACGTEMFIRDTLPYAHAVESHA